MWAWHRISSDFPVASLRLLLPSFPPSLPTHSLILSFPSHARKSIAETNVKWLQQRKLLAAALQLRTREDEIAVGVWRRWGRVEGLWWWETECVASKITTVSLLWGNCKTGPTYLCRELCLNFSDKQEWWQNKCHHWRLQYCQASEPRLGGVETHVESAPTWDYH